MRISVRNIIFSHIHLVNQRFRQFIAFLLTSGS